MKKYILPLLTVFIIYSIVTGIALMYKHREQLSLRPVTYTFNKYHEYVKPQSVISAKELKQLLDNEDVKVIAGKYKEEFTEYIPNSQVIQIDDVSKSVNGIKGFVADKKQVEQVLSHIGVSNEDTIVLYDVDNTSSTRLWFILTIYGHTDVLVLDGGITAWINHDYQVVKQLEKTKKTNYVAGDKANDKIIKLSEVKNSLDSDQVLFLDVRTPKEYQAGHIPNAINIPWTQSINQDKTFKSFDELKTLYLSKNISPNEKQIIVYCTFGNRASFTYFVLTQLLGYKNVILYDGSWAEYSESGLPIEK